MNNITEEVVKSGSKRAKIKRALGRVFYRTELEDLINNWKTSDPELKESTAKQLIYSAGRLEGDWQNWGGSYLYSYDNNVDILEVLEAICKRPHYYLSHYSALYFNNLVEQRPNQQFVTNEKKGRITRENPPQINQYKVRQAFLKPSRVSNDHVLIMDQKITLLQKHLIDSVGVEDKVLNFQNQIIKLKITNLHRTFVDSVISPHYSGGVATVTTSFKDTKLSADKLMAVYETINPVYPYWQTIGLLLQSLGLDNEVKKWKSYFKGKEVIPCYISHEAKPNWENSKEWNVSYPAGVLGK